MHPFAYTGGPNNMPEIMVARNLRGASKLRLHNHGLHSMATLLWNISFKVLHPEIIIAMTEEMASMPRADWGLMGK